MTEFKASAGESRVSSPDALSAELAPHSGLQLRQSGLSEGRLRAVAQAVHAWRVRLVDLSRRNNLLYFRHLKAGTLDLRASDEDALEAFLGGGRVRLSHLFLDPQQRQDAARRSRTIRGKARENYEEKGLETVRVALGAATWTPPSAGHPPSAPVLLAAVELTPVGVSAEDFDLQLAGDWEVNPSLIQAMSMSHGVTINVDDLGVLPPEDGVAPGLAVIFDRLRASCTSVPGFGLHDGVALGNFSYARMPMVEDLAGAFDELVQHDLIAALAGDAEAQVIIRERKADVSLDAPNLVPLQDEFLVLPADASQNYAINAVLAGADLVIQGPPGTGKSQTISNLIASLIARGMTVLFVAAKRAAIDAVTERLHNLDLTDFILDLHDGTRNRKRFAQDLARTLQIAAAQPPVSEEHFRPLARNRERLVQHAKTVYQERRSPWDMSFHELVGEASVVPVALRLSLRLSGQALGRLSPVARTDLSELLTDFASLRGHIDLFGPDPSPWATASVTGSISTAEEVGQAREAVAAVSHLLPGLINAFGSSARAMGVREPRSLQEARDLVSLWRRIREIVREFTDEIFDLDLENLRNRLAPESFATHRRLAAWLTDGAYRSAVGQVRAVGKSAGVKLPSVRRLPLVEASATAASAWASISAVGSTPSVPADLDALDRQLSEVEFVQVRLGRLTQRQDLDKVGFDELVGYLSRLGGSAEVLRILPELTRLHRSLDEAGLAQFLREVGQRQFDANEVLQCFRYVWSSSALDLITSLDTNLATFRRELQDRTVEEFQQGDASHIDLTPARVRRAWALRAVKARDEFPDEAGMLMREAQRKARFKPVRDVVGLAPNVLLATKPCWALSPLVVSQVLPARQLFDVVIFDEASQVLPEEAIGALVRGRRAVIAGDDKQLPPTTVFQVSGEEDRDDEEAVILAEQRPTEDMESILKVMMTLLPEVTGSKTLNWHYRSRDEKLIQFANAQPKLYGWSLTTFPGALGEDCIRFEEVPFSAEGAGQESSSSREVNRVVDLILEHARERPQETLGVIAMGIKHANRIEESLRRARMESDDFADFFGEGGAEPFFIKNLERVQGDERDAIILTIGYGKTADGRMRYNFGPINQEGGERRLNVAITRARNRMTVVSSFGPSDLDPGRLNSEGPQMLRRFLEYAQSNGMDLGAFVKTKTPMNPFERSVFERLTAAGIPLVSQYGTGGYWIDFAASHPQYPGRMVLAIEADGAMYHSAATARDRDRLRQEHLERLGWKFHRIWSTSWFYDTEREVDLALEAYRRAIQEPSPAMPVYRERPSTRPPVQAIAAERGPKPPIWGVSTIDDCSPRMLANLFEWLQSDGLPRDRAELFRLAMDELGFKRRGSRILAAFEEALDLANFERAQAVNRDDNDDDA